MDSDFPPFPFMKSGPTQEGPPEVQGQVAPISKHLSINNENLSNNELERPMPPGTVSCNKITGDKFSKDAWVSEYDPKSFESHSTNSGAMFDNALHNPLTQFRILTFNSAFLWQSGHNVTRF